MEDVGAPGLGRDHRPRAPGPGLGRRPDPDPHDDRQHGRDLEQAEGDQAEAEGTGRHGQRADDEARHDAEDLHQPDERARRSHLRPGHEIRDIALEWTLGEVRAELEQGDEGPDGDKRVGRRDPDQEHEIEQGADEDVRLAPPPARDGVVGDRADRRLDDHGDDRPADRHEEEGSSRLALDDKPGELEAPGEDRREAGEDRRQAEPIDRDPDELAVREGRHGTSRALVDHRPCRHRSILRLRRKAGPTVSVDVPGSGG